MGSRDGKKDEKETPPILRKAFFFVKEYFNDD
jgi:hypothetical protein